MALSAKGIRIVSTTELLIGVVGILFAAVLFVFVTWRGQDSDPHGFILLGAISMVVFGVAAVISALLLKKGGAVTRIVSQLLFAAALVFIYLDWFTGYALWWAI